MFNKLYPNELYNTTYSIDFLSYFDKGYKGIIFDIDNTLVPHNSAADDRALELIKDLKKIGYKVCLLSNNKEKRVSSFSESLDNIDYIYNAKKPSRKGYIKAMKKINTNLDNTLFVGDQIFTDIWGANRTGVYTILVRPLDKKEEIQIILKRIPEKFILWCYKRKNR